ncbi:MAG: VCBS repeat-containing protein, partial [Terriglobales bacterium]
MTNFAHHPFAIPAFAMKVLRANATPALVVVATIVLASLVILAAPLASAQTFIFNRADFATGTGPSVVAVGDFNGDGHMDVVTGNDDTANTVSVLLGKGDGTFAPHVDYPAGGGVTGIAVGDVNGDGKLDIVVLYG